MFIFSKLELIHPQLKFIVDDSIPSIHSEVRLRSGQIFQLHAVHPTPPMPQENPPSTDRDAELMKTALETLDADLPVIVIGDLMMWPGPKPLRCLKNWVVYWMLV